MKEITKTEEDALLSCFDLWIWLSAFPEEEKEDWPGWEDNGGTLQACEHNCPVCEYTNVEYRSTPNHIRRESNQMHRCQYGRKCPINWTYNAEEIKNNKEIDKLILSLEAWEEYHPDWCIECETYGTRYYKWKWNHNDLEEKSKCALEIAILALDALDRLEGK